MDAPPVVTLLTDYGLEDEFVGVCHGVIAGICPPARIIDVSHGIARHDVRAGALTLASALPFLPIGVHVAVVDPGVGTDRRAVALELADGRLLVGPDNGLLSVAAAIGDAPVVAAVEISHSPLALEPVSATFHGRDIFAPVAAHLAAGVPLADAGARLDPASLVTLELPGAVVAPGALTAVQLHADRFGNVQLAATGSDLEAAGLRDEPLVEVRAGGRQRHRARVVRAFAEADPGELIVYQDSSGRLALAVTLGSAAARLGLADGELVTIAASVTIDEA